MTNEPIDDLERLDGWLAVAFEDFRIKARQAASEGKRPDFTVVMSVTTWGDEAPDGGRHAEFDTFVATSGSWEIAAAVLPVALNSARTGSREELAAFRAARDMRQR